MARDAGLPELLQALRWRWKLALVIAAGVTAGAVFYVHSLPSEYDGQAIIAFGPRPDVVGASADAVRVIVPKYVEYVKAPATVKVVAGLLHESSAGLGHAVDARLAQDTGTVTVTVRLRDPGRAADAANAFAEQLVRFAQSDAILTSQLVAPAIRPTAAAAPPRLLYTIAAVAVGLLLGLALSLLLERGRPRVRTVRDMRQITGAPVIGSVPFSRRLRSTVTTAMADPAVGAAFRTLCANLEPQLQSQSIRSVVVTSPVARDGKTTVAALLAEALGRRGSRTLLVDADMRRSGLSSMLRGHPAEGLKAVLRNSRPLEQAVEDSWVENLSILTTGLDAEAGDLIAKRFSSFIEKAGALFDLVILDAPPLLGADDARTILTHVDGSLLVISAGSAAGPVSEAMIAIESLDTRFLGVVANKLRASGPAYY